MGLLNYAVKKCQGKCEKIIGTMQNSLTVWHRTDSIGNVTNAMPEEKVYPAHSHRRIYICQEQIELSGFVAHELSAFSVLRGRPILRTGGERRMCAFLNYFSR